jgi:hypothetical protein
MNPNYPYPKDEIEFYSRDYSIDQLVKNYEFSHLMAYYLFGMNTIQKIDMIIEGKLYAEIGRTPDEVYDDKMYFTLRTFVIRNAMSKMDTCDIVLIDDKVMVLHNN